MSRAWLMDGLLTAPSRFHFERLVYYNYLSSKRTDFFTDSPTPSPDNIVIGNLECTFPFALEAGVSVVYWCVITSLEVGRERPLCCLYAFSISCDLTDQRRELPRL